MAEQTLESVIKTALDAITDKRCTYSDTSNLSQKAKEQIHKAVDNAKLKEKTLNSTIASKWSTILIQSLPSSSNFIAKIAQELLKNKDFIKALESMIRGG